MGRVRSGAPTSGTVAAEGSDNSLTDPRIILFDPPVRPCIVTNHCVLDEIVVKVNTETSGTVSEKFEVANGLGHFIIPPRATLADTSKDPPEGGECWVDVSMGGQIVVHSVSFCTRDGSDDLADVSVVGFAP